MFSEELYEDWCEDVVPDGFWSLRETRTIASPSNKVTLATQLPEESFFDLLHPVAYRDDCSVQRIPDRHAASVMPSGPS